MPDKHMIATLSRSGKKKNQKKPTRIAAGIPLNQTNITRIFLKIKSRLEWYFEVPYFGQDEVWHYITYLYSVVYRDSGLKRYDMTDVGNLTFRLFV